jgi:small-conductance mechanosensitive channel
MKRLFLVLFFIFFLAPPFYAAQENVNANAADKAKAQVEQKNKESDSAAQELRRYKNELAQINEDLHDNIWMKRYHNYITYSEVSKEFKELTSKSKRYARWKEDKWKKLAVELAKKAQIKENEVKLLEEYKISPIGNYINPPDIGEVPKVANPFTIIEAISYTKKLVELGQNYQAIMNELSELIMLLENKKQILENILAINKKEEHKEELNRLKTTIKDLTNTLETVSSTNGVFSRRIEQITIEINNDIKNQINKAIKISLIITVLLVLAFIIKMGLKKYYRESESYFVTNKVINFILVIIIINILLFAYIENVDYLVTILGFASAGIAIALKDWFMSIFGWLVIISGGMINIGDRIKVQRSGIEVVGDVLDISMFRITVREDITLTSYMENRRSGRIYFIPNNYIFTDMISNYSHAGLRTVWDGIDINITFDSNHKKAQAICKEIVKQYSKGYTDITRRRLNVLRDKYDLRVTNVEPRVFTFIEPYGMRVSSWYLTNSFATLTLRSTISAEILDAFNAEDDITIAYPTQTINVSQGMQQLENIEDIEKIAASQMNQPSLF